MNETFQNRNNWPKVRILFYYSTQIKYKVHVGRTRKNGCIDKMKWRGQKKMPGDPET